MPSRLAASVVAVASSAILPAPSAFAFLIGPQPPSPTMVVEYFNTQLDRYFYTLDPAEQTIVDSGGVGPGWVRTGLEFGAFASLDASRFGTTACDAAPVPCAPIARFYAPGANSHFFTANAAEAAALSAPGTGWKPEGTGFFLPATDASGQCHTGLAPIYRLYNGRGGEAVDHRFTPSRATRDYLIGRGWRDEGTAFCAYFKSAERLDTRGFGLKDPAGVQPVDACNAQDSGFESCVGIANLTIPTQVVPGLDSPNVLDPFNLEVGWQMPVRYELNVAMPLASPYAAADNTFVQLTSVDNGEQLAVHLTTLNGAGGAYSSISPLRKLATQAPAPGQPDRRLFPYRIEYGTDYELVMDFNADAWKFSADGPGSAAYGVASIKFVDARSGRALQLNASFYGTPAAGSEFVAVDANNGLPIVASSFGRASRYGRFDGLYQGAPDATTPAYFMVEPLYTERIHRGEFKAVIDAARAIDPMLSSDPADYLVASFRLVNEIYGMGDIALYMRAPAVSREARLD